MACLPCPFNVTHVTLLPIDLRAVGVRVFTHKQIGDRIEGINIMSDYQVGLTFVDALPNCGECKVEVCEFVGYEPAKVPALYCGACSTGASVRLISRLALDPDVVSG